MKRRNVIKKEKDIPQKKKKIIKSRNISLNSDTDSDEISSNDDNKKYPLKKNLMKNNQINNKGKENKILGNKIKAEKIIDDDLFDNKNKIKKIDDENMYHPLKKRIKEEDDNMVEFPYEFTERLIDALSCFYCKGIYVRPYVINITGCGHIFCLGCIIKLLEDGESGICPKCKNHFTERNIKYSEVTDYYIKTFFPEIPKIIEENKLRLNQFMIEKQEINEIKEKIEKSKIAINNQNDKDEEEQNKLLIKLKDEENKLKKLEANKLKQIEDLKTKNYNLKNMISTLSSTLNKQNEEKSQISELNHEISFKEDITIIPNNNTTFFSVIGDASQFFPKSEIFIKKKEAKLKKIKILNEIYAKKKKKLKEASILEINSSKKREESFNSSLIIKKKQRSKILNLNKSKKEENNNNNNNNNNNEINEENILLKDDIKDLDDKIKEAQKEIENMKNLYDKEIKSLQEKK